LTEFAKKVAKFLSKPWIPVHPKWERRC